MKKLLVVFSVAMALFLPLVGCTDPKLAPPENNGGASETLPEQGGTAPVQGESTPSTGTGENTTAPEQEEITKMYVTINGNKAEITLEKNSATDALVEILKNGDITFTVNDHGGFEKYGSLGQSLPHSDTKITAQAGDVMLYLGNQMVLFYGSNSWDYTRLGRIEGYSAAELRTLLCADKNSVQVTLSLN